jgi:hypothetical protein
VKQADWFILWATLLGAAVILVVGLLFDVLS